MKILYLVDILNFFSGRDCVIFSQFNIYIIINVWNQHFEKLQAQITNVLECTCIDNKTNLTCWNWGEARVERSCSCRDPSVPVDGRCGCNSSTTVGLLTTAANDSDVMADDRSTSTFKKMIYLQHFKGTEEEERIWRELKIGPHAGALLEKSLEGGGDKTVHFPTKYR